MNGAMLNNGGGNQDPIPEENLPEEQDEGVNVGPNANPLQTALLAKFQKTLAEFVHASTKTNSDLAADFYASGHNLRISAKIHSLRID